MNSQTIKSLNKENKIRLKKNVWKKIVTFRQNWIELKLNENSRLDFSARVISSV